MTLDSLQIHTWDGEGYRSFVDHRGWLVALMNWEPRFDPAGVGPIERHNQTDEVFVLLNGCGVIFTVDEIGVHPHEMRPGVIYNVPAAIWHSVIGSRDATWLIVESSDTSLENSDYRQLTPAELVALRPKLPDWAKD